MTKSGISIIVPTYTRAELLRKALASIQALDIPAGWGIEVLVIDNNSSDHTPDIVAESHDQGPIPVQRILEKKQGLNHGRNAGLLEASYEHLVFLDDDMIIDSCWLHGYVEAIEAFAPDAVVGPVMPMYEAEPIDDWLTPRLVDSVSSSYSQKGDALIVVPTEKAHELPGCNFAVRKHVAISLGGFHSALDRSGSGMLAGGDWEFGERLVRNGYRTAYSPKCRIQHLVSRHKLSKPGLRARWEGIGATARAMGHLRGNDQTIVRRISLTARMVRLMFRSIRYAVLGDQKSSFRWELEALQLKGYLFYNPKRLQVLEVARK